MNFLSLVWQWLSSSSNWAGENGVPARLTEHLAYSATALIVAAAIALPVGLLTGHFRKGGFLVICLGNAARAMPTIGLLTLMVFLVGLDAIAPLTALVAIAIPPILVNSYEAVRQVPRDVVDAAQNMGMTPRQVLFRVEIPAAMSLILIGIRGAAVQVVATATIAAYVGMGGLGRYIFDGLATRDYQLVAVGAALAAVCAVAVEGAFVAFERLVVSPGLLQRSSRFTLHRAARRPVRVLTPEGAIA
jgi:osmoprotectant transport system permease protein